MIDRVIIYELSKCMYHEARGEPPVGIVLAAKTILNRTRIHGMTVKQVIWQPGWYSWTMDPKLRSMTLLDFDSDSYENCRDQSFIAINEYLNGDTGQGVTHYHHHAITPYWAKSMNVCFGRKGDHIFYKGK